MRDESVQHPLRTVVELLERHGVEYIVIGGQAEALMGSPRATYDVDLCYRRTPENIARLASALAEFGVSFRGAPAGLPFRPDARTIEAGLNFTFETPAGAVDFLGKVEPIGAYEQLAERAEEYQAWNHRIRSISLDDLIRVKRHIARPRDTDSLFQLMAIKRVRETGTGS